MGISEIALIGVALSMDAVAVGMTNGMTEPNMRVWKMFCVAGMYALFQFLMPLVGYYCGYAFSSLVAKIAPWLSFALLAFIGGKMIADYFKENAEKKRTARRLFPAAGSLGAGKLLMQAVATSIDALAVGVTLLAEETEGALPLPIVFCALVIGTVTFELSSAAVALGKKIGDAFSDKATLLGGAILLAIGAKILIESFLA